MTSRPTSDARILPVAIVVGGKHITGWISYEIEVSIDSPPSTFRLQLPFDREVWELTKPDTPVQIVIGDRAIVTGFIDDSPMADAAEVIDIQGRCRVGRLTDDSAPGINFSGLGIKDLADKLTEPFFPKRATLSNARNRDLVRGKGKKARAASEPVRINTRTGTAIEPGQTRWSVLERLLQQTGYLAWSSGDGAELIIGKPNYDQDVQYVFMRPMPGSARAAEGNVLGIGIGRSTATRYARVICVGSGAGTDANYGATVASRYGEAKNNPSDPQGIGKDFTVPKTLVVQNPVKSIDEATELAKREMAQRDAGSRPITVRAAGHGQIIAGQYVTIFAPDTLAFVEDEYTGTRGVYLITSCNYRSDRAGGDETVMTLIPKGTELKR